MDIQTFSCGPLETNSYLLIFPESAIAAVIDPSPGSAPLHLKEIQKRQVNLEAIFLTHSHWDHIADTHLLKNKSTNIWVHRSDALNLAQPGTDGIPCWLSITGVQATHFCEDGQTIPLGNTSFQVIHTPGHSPGGVCFYFPQEKILFSGDTLFKGTIGRLDLPTGQPRSIAQSLQKLAQLPKDTLVLPGHGPKTTIGNERDVLFSFQ